jgi:hypothetical protein
MFCKYVFIRALSSSCGCDRRPAFGSNRDERRLATGHQKTSTLGYPKCDRVRVCGCASSRSRSWLCRSVRISPNASNSRSNVVRGAWALCKSEMACLIVASTVSMQWSAISVADGFLATSFSWPLFPRTALSARLRRPDYPIACD